MSATQLKEEGNNYVKSKEYGQAIDAYTRAIKLEPYNHVLYSNRSAAYLNKGDAESALADGLKCTQLNKSWPKGYSRHAAALHSLERYDEAITIYNKGLSICPGDAGLKSGLEDVKKAKAGTIPSAHSSGNATPKSSDDGRSASTSTDGGSVGFTAPKWTLGTIQKAGKMAGEVRLFLCLCWWVT